MEFEVRVDARSGRTDGEGLVVETVALLDARQVRFSVDGSDLGERFIHEVPGGGGRLVFGARIPKEEIGEGGHSLIVAAFGLGRLAHVGFTLFAGRYGFDPVESTPGGRPYRGGPTALPAVVPETPDGRMAVRTVLTGVDNGCPEVPVGVFAVVFLDRRQITWGDLGHTIRARLKDGEALEFAAELKDLPRDGRKHELMFVTVWGEQMYPEDSFGGRTPWPLVVHARRTVLGGP